MSIFHAPVFLPEQLLSSQDDKRKTNTYSKKFGIRVCMIVFVCLFHPSGNSVAAQARKLEDEKKYLLTQKIGFKQ